MRSRALLQTTLRLFFPLARLALCLDCEVCFEIGPEKCPACGSATWSPLSRFIGETADKTVVRAVEALVQEARGMATRTGGQHLLIVSRTQPKLFDMLRRELADHPTLTVIQDRRGQGPRPTSRVPNQRWRNVDFQIRALGWAIVRAESSRRGSADSDSED
jgi:hypothetical protein